MKKYLFIGIAATAMLASCTNDEIVEMAPQGNAIGFSTFVDNSTRAVTETKVANLGEITVYGWRGESLLFNGQKVTIATDGKGTYTPTKYWEAGYTYSFEAIKEVAGATLTAAQTGGKITFDNTANGGKATTDLVYAKVADTEKINADFSNVKTVDFIFNHLLSKVKFTFTNGFTGSDAKLSIANVNITNSVSKAETTPQTTTKTNGNATWTATNDATDLNVSFATNTADIEVDATVESEEMLLIPANKKYLITFDATLNQNGVKTTYHKTAEITLTNGLQAGYSYNFTATLDNTNITEDGSDLKPIVFSADVYNWQEYSDNSVTITPAANN